MSKQQKGIIKKFVIAVVPVYVILVFLPAVVFGIWGGSSVSPAVADEPTVQASEILPAPSPSENNMIPGFLETLEKPADTANTNADSEDIFKILDSATGETITVSAQEFLPAAVVCEMPLSAPVEALKAQAVAAYTYYSRERKFGGNEHANFTCNTDSWLIYVTKEDMQERWGEDFESNYAKIKAITDEVYGELLTYEGEPICSAYFNISNGSTEACANVWGSELSYLSAVASPGDVLSDGYLSTVTLSPDQVQQALSASLDYTFNFSLPNEEWFQNQDLSAAGYTKTITVCDASVKGTELRTALSLSSTCFDVSYTNGYYIFTVRGHGHGVGMSQAGAIFMAQQGSGYKDILSHYYPGSTLEISK